MNLKKLYEVASTVSVAGIKQVIIQKEDQGVTVRATDENRRIIGVVSYLPDNIVEHTLGVHRVDALIQRLRLFDLDKVKADVDDQANFIRSINLKEGRKKAKISFADPEKIGAPKRAVDDSISNKIVLDKERIDQIAAAVSTMQPQFLTVYGKGDEIILELKEKDSGDTFMDVIGKNATGDWENRWDVGVFIRLTKQAIKDNDEVVMGIGERGFLCITVNDIEFMLLPQTLPVGS